MDTLLLHRKTIMTWWFWIIVALGLSLVIMFGSNAGASECLHNDKEVRAKFPGSWPSWRGNHCWYPKGGPHDNKKTAETKTTIARLLDLGTGTTRKDRGGNTEATPRQPQHRVFHHTARGALGKSRQNPAAEKEWTDSSHIITWMTITAGKMAKLREDRKALNARIQEWFYIQATYKPFCGPTPDWQSCTVSPREVQSIPEPRQNSVTRISRTDNARVGKVGRGKGEGRFTWDTAAYFR